MTRVTRSSSSAPAVRRAGPCCVACATTTTTTAMTSATTATSSRLSAPTCARPSAVALHVARVLQRVLRDVPDAHRARALLQDAVDDTDARAVRAVRVVRYYLRELALVLLQAPVLGG